MKYRPSPDFIIVLVIIAALVSLSAYLIASIVVFEYSKEPVQMSHSVLNDLRPDIRHCFEPDETRTLWNCIRHEGS